MRDIKKLLILSLVLFGGALSSNLVSADDNQQEVVFPSIVQPEFDEMTFTAGVLNQPGNRNFVYDSGEYSEFWNETSPKRDCISLLVLYQVASHIEYKNEERVALKKYGMPLIKRPKMYKNILIAAAESKCREKQNVE